MSGFYRRGNRKRKQPGHHAQSTFKSDLTGELQLIPLPTATSKVWKYFGMYSSDGQTIIPEHSSRVFCMVPGCPAPELGYCGNTTNLYSHLERRHPEVELPEKRKPPAGTGRPSVRPASAPEPGVIRRSALSAKFARRVAELKKRNQAITEIKRPNRRKPSNDINYGDLTSFKRFIEKNQTLSDAYNVTAEKNKLIKENDFISRHTGSDLNTKDVPTDFEVTDALAEFLIGDCKYLSLLNSMGFAKFVKFLCPNYQMPTFENMLEEVLKERFFKCKNILKNVICQMSTVAISAESWITAEDKTFLAIYVHFIDNDWSCNRHLLTNLKFASAQSAEYLAEDLHKTLESWGIQSEKGPVLTSVTTDYSPIVSAAAHYYLSTPHVPSLEVALVVGIQEGLSGKLVTLLLGKTWKMLEDLAETQPEQHGQVQELQARLDGKWKSTHAILGDVLNLYSNAKNLRKDVLLTEHEWNEMEALVEILDELLKWSEVLSTSQHMEASVILPFRHQMHESVFKSRKNDLPVIANFKEDISLKLEDTYMENDGGIFLEKCTFLDPRFKNLAVYQNQLVLDKEIKTEMAEVICDSQKTSNYGPGKLEKLFGSLPRDCADGNEPLPIEKEFVLYKECKPPNYDTNPCNWWKEHKCMLPRLANLAKKYLSIPSTVYVDLDLVTNRNSLPTDAIDMMTFLNNNSFLTK